MKMMTKDEKSLLLYLETRAVDHSGRVETVHMNATDTEIATRWSDTGFIKFGRIASDSLSGRSSSTHWCLLSEGAWEKAAQLRRARAERTWEKRNYLTTLEKRTGEKL